MNKKLLNYVLILLFFVLLAFIVFRCGWGKDRIFSGSDSNIAIIAGAHGVLPERFSGLYSPTPVFGGVSSVPVSFINIGQWVLPPAVFTDVWYGVYLVLSSVFLIAFLRLWKLRWTSCIFGSLAAFWLGSVTLSAAGHLAKLGVMTFFTLALLLVEKGIRSTSHWKRLGFGIGAGIATGLMLLEQQDVALLAGLFLAAYTLFRLCQNSLKKPLAWAELLIPIATVGLLMAVSTAQQAYKANVTDVALQKSPEVQWDYITQWSMVPQELPDLIAPGYTGWKTNDPKGPYWGKIGQSPEWESTKQGFRNFRLDSLYMGVLPIFLGLFGIVAAFRFRKEEKELSSVIICWAGLALTALLLSFGKYSPLYKLFYHLPLVGNIRAPIKFLHNFQVLNAILATYGLDQLLRKEWGWKKIIVFFAIPAALFVIFALGIDATLFKEWGSHADMITRTTRFAWLHAAGMTLLLVGIVYCRWKKVEPKWQVGCLAILIGATALDSIALTNRYFSSENIAHLNQGNALFDYIEDNQGDDRIYFLDQSGVYNRWLAVDAGYHRLRVFNFWQMPRMPTEYKNFFNAAGRDLTRIWQLASVKYITAPAEVLGQIKEPLKSQLRPVMYYRFFQQGEGVGVQTLSKPGNKQDQVLLEFDAFIPHLALFHHWESMAVDQQCAAMFSPQFDPLKTLLVDADASLSNSSAQPSRFVPVQTETNLKSAIVETNSDQDGVLLFTQRYQPNWRVLIDGEPGDIFKCNYLNIGVFVPAGRHTVEFTIR